MSSTRLVPVSLALLAGCAATAPNPKPDFSSNPDWNAAPVASDPAPRGPSLAAEPLPTGPIEPAAPLAAGEHNGRSGQWEFTLGASGVSDKQFDAGSAAGNASLGVYLGDYFELAARQSVAFFDSGASGSDTNASTSLAADIVFFSGGFRPFLGASVGYVYGDTVRETWMGGPEAGFKIYIKEDVFVQLLAQYQFFFQKGDEIDDQFDDGSLVYALGLGVNF